MQHRARNPRDLIFLSCSGSFGVTRWTVQISVSDSAFLTHISQFGARHVTVCSEDFFAEGLPEAHDGVYLLGDCLCCNHQWLF